MAKGTDGAPGRRGRISHVGPIGYMGVTHEWRYPVVDRREPMGIRTVKGYIYVTRRESGGPPRYGVSIYNAENLPLHVFDPDDFWLFAGAVREALKEIGLDQEAEAELLARGGISRPLHAWSDTGDSEPAHSDP